MVTYGSETWTLTKSAETVLNTWERKVLRKIFGPTKDENGWRMRTNKEVYDLYKDPTIVAEIKKEQTALVGPPRTNGKQQSS